MCEERAYFITLVGFQLRKEGHLFDVIFEFFLDIFVHLVIPELYLLFRQREPLQLATESIYLFFRAFLR